jgi:hypothetical protein
MGMGMPLPDGSDAQLRETMEELARRVADLEAKGAEAGVPAPSLEFSDSKLATIATSIYRARRRRESLFDTALFGEPAWDMLLDLFINGVRGVRVSTTSLCLAASVPQTTGLRWIDQLVEHGLARRYTPPDDGRLKLVEITTEGFRRMRRYVSEGVTRFEMPTPD